MEEAGEQQGLLSLTTEIVTAFAAHNTVATSDLPGLIGTVYAAPRAAGAVEAEKPVEALVPAVPIKKSVMPEFIVCLEDGKKLKMLKRHLATRYNMTPAEYRARRACPTTIRWWPQPMRRCARISPRASGSAASQLTWHPSPNPSSGSREAGSSRGGRSQAAEDSSLNGCPRWFYPRPKALHGRRIMRRSPYFGCWNCTGPQF